MPNLLQCAFTRLILLREGSFKSSLSPELGFSIPGRRSDIQKTCEPFGNLLSLASSAVVPFITSPLDVISS